MHDGCRPMMAALLATLLIISNVSTAIATTTITGRQNSPSQQDRSKELDEANRLRAEVEKSFVAGRYFDALAPARKLQAILERVLGPDHPDTISFLNNLALIYHSVGNYAKAEPLYRRVLDVREKNLGPEHASLVSPLNNLSLLYFSMGDFTKAEPEALRALAIREKLAGPDHPDVASSLDNLALIYSGKGDYAKAETLHNRALSIFERKLGPDHLAVALPLNNLAKIYYTQGDYSKATPLFERALAIREKVLGPDHPAVALSSSNLGVLFEVEGRYQQAAPLYERALAIYEKNFGRDHFEVGLAVNNLGWLHYRKGDYEKAESLFKRSLAIWEKDLGADHPSAALSLSNLATLYEAKGELSKAIAHRSRGNENSERQIAINLAAGSEQQKLLYLATFAEDTDRTVSLHLHSAPADAAAARVALLTVLRRKGRVLDAMADSLGALRRRLAPEDRELLDRLADVRTRLAATMLGRGGTGDPARRREDLQRLEEEEQRLQAEVSRRSAEFRAQSRPVTLEAVQAAIPADAALIEFATFRPFDAKFKKYSEQFGDLRYAAYLLRNKGELQWVDLGEAKAIDARIESLRARLRSSKSKDFKRLARELDSKVMEPVRKLLGETGRILLSPEGALNLVPFAALVDERGRYLVERYSITYLTTGRDLLRLEEPVRSKQGAVVIANPDFGGETEAGDDRELKVVKKGGGKASESSPEAVDFSQVYFKPLPGTAEEAEALKTILRRAKVLTGSEATEEAVKELAGPTILHIATHGFFLDSVVAGPAPVRVASQGQGGESLALGMKIENPLLRSGLGLAGANLKEGEGGDGILTALEAAVLNLWGTKLVVLSACDTGVGEVRRGDGVHGLRRALVLAGSESQVMSLWPVNDEGTRDLMIDYYRALEAGQGRSEALRRVQLKMIASKRRSHPYYWASFIQSGEWANLDGKR
ncbi:MAG: tetratricopeptide repeat protein [Blastocatellia bacterium]|nr:tetratricopeptide repeat protein [Blastocatellia bacterium]